MGTHANRTLFIACGVLAKETKTIIDRRGWQVDLKALPALHHMTLLDCKRPGPVTC